MARLLSVVLLVTLVFASAVAIRAEEVDETDAVAEQASVADSIEFLQTGETEETESTEEVEAEDEGEAEEEVEAEDESEDESEAEVEAEDESEAESEDESEAEAEAESESESESESFAEVSAFSGSKLTTAQLTGCMPGLTAARANQMLPHINSANAGAAINTCKRMTAWLAQLGHESSSLRYMEEIASGAAYEGRRDLGNTQRGDGKRFKGRGPIQLTGRANYVAAGKALHMNLVGNPAIVATPSVGFKTSAWFWTTHGLNALADRGQFSSITRKINGGTNGAADRNSRYAKCKRVLGC